MRIDDFAMAPSLFRRGNSAASPVNGENKDEVSNGGRNIAHNFSGKLKFGTNVLPAGTVCHSAASV